MNDFQIIHKKNKSQTGWQWLLKRDLISQCRILSAPRVFQNITWNASRLNRTALNRHNENIICIVRVRRDHVSLWLWLGFGYIHTLWNISTKLYAQLFRYYSFRRYMLFPHYKFKNKAKNYDDALCGKWHCERMRWHGCRGWFSQSSRLKRLYFKRLTRTIPVLNLCSKISMEKRIREVYAFLWLTLHKSLFICNKYQINDLIRKY